MRPPMFMRYAEMGFPNFTLRSTDLKMEFSIPFDNDTEPNESTITFYNLSRNTINSIKKDDLVSVNAGYRGDVGRILEGRVSHVETDPTGTDKATRIYVLDSDDLHGVKTVNKSYAAGTKASTIVNDLLPMLGVPVAVADFPKNPVYEEGYTVEGDLKESLSKLAGDCGVSFYINNHKAYFQHIHAIKGREVVEINADTGLIGSPEPFQDGSVSGYKVQCLLQHRITTASIINLRSKHVNGVFKVIKGEHDGNNFITTMDVIP